MSLSPNSEKIATSGDVGESWARAERLPVLLASESPVAEFIQAQLRRKPIRFAYWGGSAPGEIRRVLVTEVFQLFEDGPVYSEGFCFKRKSERVFRLDRVTLARSSWGVEDTGW